MNKKFIALSLVFALFYACSSRPPEPTTTAYEEDKVVGRSDGLTARPEWVKETINVRETDKGVQFIGMREVPGDSRPTAAFKMADAEARGSIAAKLKTEIIRFVESSDSGLKMEDQKLEAYVQELSEVKLTNVDVKDRYWEKVVRMDSTGQKSMVLKVFSLIEIPKHDLEKMLMQQSKNADAPADMKNKVETMIRSEWSE